MTVHSFHIFDRRGKTLYTKRYTNAILTTSQSPTTTTNTSSSQTTNPNDSNGHDKNNSSTSSSSYPSTDPNNDELLAEQRKLIFGMLFSLRELVGSLVPEGSRKDLHSIKTGASTLHNYETLSGLRFALFTSNDVISRSGANGSSGIGVGGGGGSGSSSSSSKGIGSTSGGGIGGSSSGKLNSSNSSSSSLSNSSSVSSLTSSKSKNSSKQSTPSIREALQYIYSELWVECVIRSPLYRVGTLGELGEGEFDIRSTNFEKKLEAYFATMSWFK